MPAQRGQNFRRNLLVELHVLLEPRHDRAGQHVKFTVVAFVVLVEHLRPGGKAVVDLKLVEPRSRGALDEHLDRTVRQLEQLEDLGDGPDQVEVRFLRLVHVRLGLGDEEDVLAGFHGLIERNDGLLPPDEERYHHVRVHDDVPQGQYRQTPAAHEIGPDCFHAYFPNDCLRALRQQR